MNLYLSPFPKQIQLLASSTVEEQETWGLRHSGSDHLQCFSYLRSSSPNKTECLVTTRKAMQNVGISTTKQQQLFQVGTETNVGSM